VYASHSSSTCYALSLHDALPILMSGDSSSTARKRGCNWAGTPRPHLRPDCRKRLATTSARAHLGGTVMRRFRFTRSALCALVLRSEEHTSELQSRGHLVCRLLLA